MSIQIAQVSDGKEFVYDFSTGVWDLCKQYPNTLIQFYVALCDYYTMFRTSSKYSAKQSFLSNICVQNAMQLFVLINLTLM